MINRQLKDRKTEEKKDRKIERQKERKIERQKDRKTERKPTITSYSNKIAVIASIVNVIKQALIGKVLSNSQQQTVLRY